MDIDTYVKQVQEQFTLTQLAEAMNVRESAAWTILNEPIWHYAAWTILNEPIWRYDLTHIYLPRLGRLTGHQLEMVPTTQTKEVHRD